MSVEAAVFLPVFLIGILTLACLIRSIYIEEGVFHCLEDQSRGLIAEAYLTQFTETGGLLEEVGGDGFLNGALFSLRMESRMEEEGKTGAVNFRITQFEYMKQEAGLSGMIRLRAEYDVKLGLPNPYYSVIPASDTLLFRAFIGKREAGQPLDFTEMEKDADGKFVYVFPRSGERYHRSSCPVIVVYPTEELLRDGIRNRYRACELCEPETLPDGALVYCFEQSGRVYHLGSCTSVERYVVELEKESAEREGYTACQKCGGYGR